MSFAPGTTDGVTTSLRDGVADVLLDRPPRNLLAPDLMSAVRGALLAADSDEAVRVVVLRGAGDTFCGGLDLGRLQAGGDPVEFAAHLVDLLRVFPGLGKPVIAAVNGDALAGGFALAGAADIVLAVEGARLGTFETSVGLWPMVAQVVSAQRLLPRHALANILSGEPFDTQRAYEVGAVTEIVPVGGLEAAVARWVALVTRASPTALAVGRQTFYRLLDLAHGEALDEAERRFSEIFPST